MKNDLITAIVIIISSVGTVVGLDYYGFVSVSDDYLRGYTIRLAGGIYGVHIFKENKLQI